MFLKVLKIQYKFMSLFLKEGHTVAQLVENLRYKPEGRGFDSQWYHRNVSFT
jgi:hypothetical protein